MGRPVDFIASLGLDKDEEIIPKMAVHYQKKSRLWDFCPITSSQEKQGKGPGGP